MASSSNTRILVIDDTEADQERLVGLLESEGYEVLFADDQSALDILREDRIDLILLDIASTDEGGVALTARLKSDDELAHIPVIVIAAPDDDVWRRALRVGAEDLVVHPFHELELLHRVRNLVRLKQLEDFVEQRRLSGQSEPVDSNVVKRAMRKSQRLEAMGQLAGGVAHDFNNLLTIIAAYATFAIDAIDEEHAAQAELSEILVTTTKAAALTRQLLLFSQQRPFSMAATNVTKNLATLSRLLRRTLGENIQLDTFIGASHATVLADATQLDQLIMNLAVNARDAMPTGGMLALGVDIVDVTAHVKLDPGPYVRLTVSDTGVGMSPEVVDRAFEPFFTTKGDNGTGLGLATAYGIVQTLGGFIEIDSGVDVGTTFTIWLPAVDEEASTTDMTEIVRLRGDECILVVEDQPALRRIALRSLSKYGYQVLLAGDSMEAQRRFTRYADQIDLVITDIVLPNGSGHELAAWITERAPGTTLLLTSGFLGAKATPNFPLLWKPYTPLHLVTRVRQLLDG